MTESLAVRDRALAAAATELFAYDARPAFAIPGCRRANHHVGAATQDDQPSPSGDDHSPWIQEEWVHG